MKKALLVGINEYLYQPTLTGCLNDVSAISNLLKRYYGFEYHDILTILNSQATAEMVMGGLKWLFESNSDAENTLFFMYSGHGSYVKDLNQEENDKKDEVLACYDFIDYGSEYEGAVLDDLITKYILKSSPTTLIEVLVDACYSGTIFDFSNQQIRDHVSYYKHPEFAVWTAAENDEVARVNKSAVVDDTFVENNNHRGNMLLPLTQMLLTEEGRKASRQQLFSSITSSISFSEESKDFDAHQPTLSYSPKMNFKPFLTR